MRKRITIFFGLLLLAYCSQILAEDATSLSLMPWPEKVSLEPGQFRLDPSFTMGINRFANERLRSYAQRILQRLANRTGLFFHSGEVQTASNASTAAMTLTCKREEKLQTRMDESYRLQVRPDAIGLDAETDIGLVRGLETFLQLLCTDAAGYYFPVVTIDDRPRFAWRGLLLDVCRHFFSVDAIKRNLDGMAMVKMNVFHWHLSENQGFRVECKTFPRLHQQGSDGLYYTQDQVRDVIRYAEMRGLRVVPEFDIPGHSTAWLVGYPELGSGKGPYSIERQYGVFDPTFNPVLKKTYTFFDRFFAEMSRLFTDEYMHIGGDEVNGKEWDANPAIQAFKKKNGMADNMALQDYFNRRIFGILKKHGKKMVGWDEIFVPGLDRGAVIQSWRGTKALAEAARSGYQVILANGYYIDLMQDTAFHYQNDPLPEGSALTAREQANVLGGEATMWAELVTEETIDSRIWPRTAAIAERLWSAGSVRDVDDMFRRLGRASVLLEEVGLCHIKNRDMMMRRLSAGNGELCTALFCLSNLVEPLEEYNRHEQGKTYTFFSPFTRLVDTAIVDPGPALEFESLVARFLEIRDEKTARALLDLFADWSAAASFLQAGMDAAPVLGETLPLVKNFAALAGIGREAVTLIWQKKKPEDAWIAASREMMLQAQQPTAEVTLRPVNNVIKLLDSVMPENLKEKEE